MKYLVILLVFIIGCSRNQQNKETDNSQEINNSDSIKLNDYQIYKRKLDLFKKNLSDSCKVVIERTSAIEYFNSIPFKIENLDSITLEQFLDYRHEKSIPFKNFDYYAFDLMKSMENAGHKYMTKIFSNENYYAVLVYLYWDCQNSCVLYSFDKNFKIIDKFYLFSYDCDSSEDETEYDMNECYYFKNDSTTIGKKVIYLSEGGKIERQ